MTGRQLYNAAKDGQIATVRTLLSTPGAQSFINWQDSVGFTPLFIAAHSGHTGVAELLIAAQCNVDLATEVKQLHPHLYPRLPSHSYSSPSRDTCVCVLHLVLWL